MTRGGRRLVLALILGLIVAPPTAEPQPSTKVARIGYLSTGTRTYAGAVQEGLRELGWVEGQNVLSEYRQAEGQVDRLAGLALDFARRKVDVIVALDTAAAHAAKDAAGGIPIVFATSDPRRLVGSLARPGGRAFHAMTRGPVDILLVQADTLFFREVKRILDFTATHRVPAIYGAREFPKAGGLISYGTNLPVLYRRLAAYVDRILRGARPGDLPVEQPTKLETIINLRTAKALGLAIPQLLLLRADEIIE